jgi:hypothetical protein
MTCHCYNEWKWGDPMDQAPILEIASAVEGNGFRPPPVFATLTLADQFIFSIGSLLAKHGRMNELVSKTREDERNIVRRMSF